MKLSRCVAFMVAVCLACVVSAQQRNKAYEDYIKKYRGIAVEEMKHYRIPASITLAQGLLESGAGKVRWRVSRTIILVSSAEVHGGGPTVRHDDDARNECFRAYRHAEESYRDHSKFLRSRSRYAPLFRLKITDYKGWARGLKKAGYATDPNYANRLINIIELYELYRYDEKGGLKYAEQYPNPHQPYLANDLLYIIARKGDTFKSIGEEFDLSHRKVRKYNDLPKDYVFRGGEIVYLEQKRRRATKEHIVYVVRAGDSMYSISQKFGVRLDRLYKMNKMKPDSPAPNVGDILRLR